LKQRKDKTMEEENGELAKTSTTPTTITSLETSDNQKEMSKSLSSHQLASVLPQDATDVCLNL
jgi:hypothetical protein